MGSAPKTALLQGQEDQQLGPSEPRLYAVSHLVQSSASSHVTYLNYQPEPGCFWHAPLRSEAEHDREQHLLKLDDDRRLLECAEELGQVGRGFEGLGNFVVIDGVDLCQSAVFLMTSQQAPSNTAGAGEVVNLPSRRGEAHPRRPRHGASARAQGGWDAARRAPPCSLRPRLSTSQSKL